MDNNNNYDNLQQNYQVVNEAPQQSNKAKVSMVCGILGAILSFIGCFCCIGYAGIPLSIVAIVMAVMSKNENGGTFNNDAKVGLVGGILGLVFLLIGFIVGIFLGVAMESMI